VVDSDGRRKPAWYATRRAFADRVVVVLQTGARGLELVVVNDGRDDDPRWEVAASIGVGVVVFDVTAETLVRDLCLFADRVDLWPSSTTG